MPALGGLRRDDDEGRGEEGNAGQKASDHADSFGGLVRLVAHEPRRLDGFWVAARASSQAPSDKRITPIWRRWPLGVRAKGRTPTSIRRARRTVALANVNVTV